MLNYLSSFLILFVLTGCIPKQSSVEKLFQTKSATMVKQDYLKCTEYLTQFQTKLNKRNPKAYDDAKAHKITAEIKNLTNDVHLNFKDKEVQGYKEYFQIAFSKDDVTHRNDYLILGLYQAIFEAYNIQKGHQLTAWMYDSKQLENLYKNLQIIKWKIKADKDLNNEYLFLTWQNNWQIELEKKIKSGYSPSWKELQELKYIQEKRESFFDSSNFSFEVLLTQLQDRVGSSLEELGVKPEDIAVETIKTIFIFL